MTSLLAAYAAAFLAMGVLDALWLGVIAKGWYAAGMGDHMAAQPKLAAAAAFYLLYPVGVVLFAVQPAGGELARAALLGALFGLFAYGTYDLTNLAVMRDWPAWLSFMDIAWGAFATCMGALAGAAALRYIAGA